MTIPSNTIISVEEICSYQFPERRAFEVSMVPTWQLALTMLTRLTTSRANKSKKTTNSKMKIVVRMKICFVHESTVHMYVYT